MILMRRSRPPRPTPRQPRLRRTPGSRLARRRPLRRLLRLPIGSTQHAVALPRLGRASVQRELAVRPIPHVATSRRLAGESDARSDPGDGVQSTAPHDERRGLDRRGMAGRECGRSRPHLRHGDVGAHAGVRPLPRSQVRSDSHSRLLFAYRRSSIRSTRTACTTIRQRCRRLRCSCRRKSKSSGWSRLARPWSRLKKHWLRRKNRRRRDLPNGCKSIRFPLAILHRSRILPAEPKESSKARFPI